MVIGNDDRRVTNAFSAFPLSATTVIDVFNPALGGDIFGTGIVIAPNHVLTAGHNAYDVSSNITSSNIRATISSQENQLVSRKIGAFGDPASNVTNVNFVVNYNTTEAREDDIALFTTSNTLLPSSDVVGIIAFVDPQTAKGYTINSAGYPTDNVSRKIQGNSGLANRDLVIATGSLSSLGTIAVVRSNGQSLYSPNVDAAPGQSGSGVWHILEGDSDPRVLGVLTQGPSYDLPVLASQLLNQRIAGTTITTDIYDTIMNQVANDSGTNNANSLP